VRRRWTICWLDALGRSFDRLRDRLRSLRCGRKKESLHQLRHTRMAVQPELPAETFYVSDIQIVDLSKLHVSTLSLMRRLLFEMAYSGLLNRFALLRLDSIYLDRSTSRRIADNASGLDYLISRWRFSIAPPQSHLLTKRMILIIFKQRHRDHASTNTISESLSFL